MGHGERGRANVRQSRESGTIREGGVGGKGRRSMRPAVAAEAGGNAVCAW